YVKVASIKILFTVSKFFVINRSYSFQASNCNCMVQKIKISVGKLAVSLDYIGLT
ncbi:12517_t:CDS:1, partial [Acaulospora colombiana]